MVNLTFKKNQSLFWVPRPFDSHQASLSLSFYYFSIIPPLGFHDCKYTSRIGFIIYFLLCFYICNLFSCPAGDWNKKIKRDMKSNTLLDWKLDFNNKRLGEQFTSIAGKTTLELSRYNNN